MGYGKARVFWLPLRPTLRAFPETSSSGINADFVSGYSCGAAVDSHHLPLGISFFYIYLSRQLHLAGARLPCQAVLGRCANFPRNMRVNCVGALLPAGRGLGAEKTS